MLSEDVAECVVCGCSLEGLPPSACVQHVNDCLDNRKLNHAGGSLADRYAPGKPIPLPSSGDDSCIVCTKDIGFLSADQKEAHVNRCLDGEPDPQLDAHIESRDLCVVCKKDLSEYSAIQMTQHLNRCLDAKARAEAAERPSVDVKEATNKSGVLELNGSIPVSGASFSCPVCQRNLNKSSVTVRLNHIKQCAKKQGISASDIAGLLKAPSGPAVSVSPATDGLAVNAEVSIKSEPIVAMEPPITVRKVRKRAAGTALADGAVSGTSASDAVSSHRKPVKITKGEVEERFVMDLASETSKQEATKVTVHAEETRYLQGMTAMIFPNASSQSIKEEPAFEATQRIATSRLAVQRQGVRKRPLWQLQASSQLPPTQSPPKAIKSDESEHTDATVERETNLKTQPIDHLISDGSESESETLNDSALVKDGVTAPVVDPEYSRGAEGDDEFSMPAFANNRDSLGAEDREPVDAAEQFASLVAGMKSQFEVLNALFQSSSAQLRLRCPSAVPFTSFALVPVSDPEPSPAPKHSTPMKASPAKQPLSSFAGFLGHVSQIIASQSSVESAPPTSAALQPDTTSPERADTYKEADEWLASQIDTVNEMESQHASQSQSALVVLDSDSDSDGDNTFSVKKEPVRAESPQLTATPPDAVYVYSPGNGGNSDGHNNLSFVVSQTPIKASATSISSNDLDPDAVVVFSPGQLPSTIPLPTSAAKESQNTVEGRLMVTPETERRIWERLNAALHLRLGNKENSNPAISSSQPVVGLKKKENAFEEGGNSLPPLSQPLTKAVRSATTLSESDIESVKGLPFDERMKILSKRLAERRALAQALSPPKPAPSPPPPDSDVEAAYGLPFSERLEILSKRHAEKRAKEKALAKLIPTPAPPLVTVGPITAVIHKSPAKSRLPPRNSPIKAVRKARASPVKQKTTVASQVIARAGQAMPDYASMGVDDLKRHMSSYALRAGAKSYMIERLEAVWKALHDPTVVQPAAPPKALSDEQVSKITETIKESALYEKVLLYELIDIKELQTLLKTVDMKIPKGLLEDYLKNQGANYVHKTGARIKNRSKK